MRVGWITCGPTGDPAGWPAAVAGALATECNVSSLLDPTPDRRVLSQLAECEASFLHIGAAPEAEAPLLGLLRAPRTIVVLHELHELGIGARAIHRGRQRAALVSAALGAAGGAVVTTRREQRLARAAGSGPTIRLPVPSLGRGVPGDSPPAQLRGRGRTTFVTLLEPAGGPSAVRGALSALEALATDSELTSRARYIVGCAGASDAAFDAVRDSIERHGLTGIATLLCELGAEECDRLARVADAVIDLGTGGVLAGAMRGLAGGTAAVVAAEGPLTDLHPGAVVAIPATDVAALARVMRELVHSPVRRAALGTEARAAADTHSLTAYARRLMQLARACAAREFSRPIAHGLGAVLAELGVAPGSVAGQRVVDAAVSLLSAGWPAEPDSPFGREQGSPQHRPND